VNAVVIYATRTGNTRDVATAIADRLSLGRETRLLSVEEAWSGLPPRIDLLVVGGPTEGHGATEPMIRFLTRLSKGSLAGVAAAAFDTRLWWPRVLSGSAAQTIARHLREAGATVVVPAESFIVSMKPRLERGELDRATSWAAGLLAKVPAEAVPA
jgi:flavodoxin